ncbi:5452_t:CDS:2 [Scutellospora calospora]|uniref:5452_t:CDS:1 n=1 Tax=Scutellospora calospora TaxID=85575 RepID=A0ACA9KUH9_9GLOM|nr:5452_t:CDS:2 [Scutellospora calospora]
MPTHENLEKWSPSQVISLLKSKKDELFLIDKDFQIIEEHRISGQEFFELTKEELRDYGLKGGWQQESQNFLRTKNLQCNFQISKLTLKLLQDHAQKEFKFLTTTHDEIVIKYNKSILSNDVTMRSIFKTKKNIEFIVTLDKKYFSSYKNLREVLQKHGIDNDEVLSAVNSVPNTILRSQFEIIGDVSAGRVDYAIKKIYPQLIGSGFEEIICVTEAKQIDIKVGVAQNLMQLEGSLDLNKNKKRKLDELYSDQVYSEYIYGIVSTSTDWYFLKHTPDQIFCSQASDYIPLVTTQLNNDEDLRKGIKTVLGKIIWMLKDRDRTNKRQCI